MDQLIGVILIPTLINFLNKGFPGQISSAIVDRFLEQVNETPCQASLELKKALKLAYLQAIAEILQNLLPGIQENPETEDIPKIQNKIREYKQKIRTLRNTDNFNKKLPPLGGEFKHYFVLYELDKVRKNHGPIDKLAQHLSEIKHFKETSEILQSPSGIEDLLPTGGKAVATSLRSLELRLIEEELGEGIHWHGDYSFEVHPGLFGHLYRYFIEQLKIHDHVKKEFEKNWLNPLNFSLQGVEVPSLSIEELCSDKYQKIYLSEHSFKPQPWTQEQWRQKSREIFEKSNPPLKIHILNRHEGLSPDFAPINVPLVGVQWKKRPLTPEELAETKRTNPYKIFDKFIELEKILTPITAESFYQSLQARHGRTNQENRTAIIGEPGTGKTKRLQEIYERILQNNLGVPIWIDLRTLGSKSISQYLKELGLQQGFTQDKHWEYLIAQLHIQKVWLLLDGLDESTVFSHGHESINLGNWLAQLKIVVTCRTSVWEALHNSFFSEFRVYQNLELNPEQIQTFIQNCLEKSQQLEGGEYGWSDLIQSPEFKRTNKIKNPLHLSMFWTTELTAEKLENLPKTQAKLYADFFHNFYSINQENRTLNFPNLSTQQNPLNAALAKLSLWAFSQPTPFLIVPDKFPRDLAEKLGSVDEDNSLLGLAVRLGYLYSVEVNPDPCAESRYAFSHATFQEYFAALAVQDWGFFLPRNSQHPDLSAEYRIFQPRWKPVILMWLGREDIEPSEKEAFIQALVQFDEGCGEWNYEKVNRGFYGYRAYFLAAAGIKEFKDCTLADQIIGQLVDWGFGRFNSQHQKWSTFLYPIVEAAKDVLAQTLPDKAIAAVVNRLDTTTDDSIRKQAASYLGRIGMGNAEAIATLVRLMETTTNEELRRIAGNSLTKIGRGNSHAIATVIQVLETSADRDTQMHAAEYLGELSQGKSDAIASLVKVLETHADMATREKAAESLSKIGRTHSPAIAALVKLLATNPDLYTRCLAAENLGKIAIGHLETISAVLDILETTPDEYTRKQAASVLEKIASGNSFAIERLLKLRETSTHQDIRKWVKSILGTIALNYSEVIAAEAVADVIQELEATKDAEVKIQVAERLWKINPGNSHAIAALVQIIETPLNKRTRMKAASLLGKIDPGNSTAIAGLIDVLKYARDENIEWGAAERLGEIGTGNPDAIAALVDLLQGPRDEENREQAAYWIEKTGMGNPKAIAALVKVLDLSRHEKTRLAAAETLSKIDPGNTEAIDALVPLMKASKEQFIRLRAAQAVKRNNPSHSEMTATLLNVLETATDERKLHYAASWVLRIDPDHPKAIAALIHLLETEPNDWNRIDVIKSIGITALGNAEAIAAIVHLLINTTNKARQQEAENTLKQIIQTPNNYRQVVSGLAPCFTPKIYQNDFDLFYRCYTLIWEATDHITYTDFYQAWQASQNKG